jgi:hypothetical protein
MMSLRDAETEVHLTYSQFDRKKETAKTKLISNKKENEKKKTPFTAKIPTGVLIKEGRWPAAPDDLANMRARVVKGIEVEWLQGPKVDAVKAVNAGAATATTKADLPAKDLMSLAAAVPVKLFLESTPARQKVLQSLTVSDLVSMSKSKKGHVTLAEQKGQCSHLLTFINLPKETKKDLVLYTKTLRPFLARSCKPPSDIPDVKV